MIVSIIGLIIVRPIFGRVVSVRLNSTVRSYLCFIRRVDGLRAFNTNGVFRIGLSISTLSSVRLRR